jgi:hypothetical protein
VKGKLLGPQGQNVKHISSVTGARVQLRGRGASQNPEADGPEDMHLEINASSEISMKQASELAYNLVETIRQEYVASVTQPLQSTQNNLYNVSGVQRATGPFYPPQYHPVTPYPSPLMDMNLTAVQFNAPHLAIRTEQHRPIAVASAMNHPVTQSPYSNPSATPITTAPKGCVPFLYPDGDAVIRSSSSRQESSSASSSMTPPVVQGNGAASSEAFPAMLSLNGSTFAVVTRPKEVTSSSRSSSSNSNSSSSSGDSGRSGDDTNSSSGSNKRRRGFKESAVYTGTSENLVPTSSTHQNTTVGERALSIIDAIPANGLSRGHRPLSESGTHSAAPSVRRVQMGLETDQKTFTAPSPQGESRSSSTSVSSSAPVSVSVCAPIVVSEPPPSVISALAAMTERRMQNKAARPMVPVFSMPSPFTPSPLSSGSTTPTPSHHQANALRSPSESVQGGTIIRTPDVTSLATAAPAPAPAVTFKLPGLTAYEDDDDEED